MKKIILIVVTILVFGFANAQNKKSGFDSSMSFGAKVGLNIANLTGGGDTKSIIGFHLGGFAEFKVNDKFAIQPELLFSTQGAKAEYYEDFGDGDSFSAKEKVNLSYLNIPIIAKFYVKEKLSIEVGPQIGFLINAKNKFSYTDTFGGETIAESGENDIKEITTSTDFSLNFGAGYNLNKNMVLGFRYNLGLSKLQKELADGEKAIKNEVFQFSFGYKF